MYLLDTVVLSEMRKRDPDHNVRAWLTSAREDSLFISAITVGEIERGIALQRRRDPRFAAALGAWLHDVLSLYGDRVLPVDIRVARHWGALAARVGHAGADLLIAATALEHGLTVVTRNVADFEPTGVSTIDPFRPALVSERRRPYRRAPARPGSRRARRG